MSDEPKIIVDDDWKSQIEKEKEQLAKEEAEKSASSEKTGEAPQELPPASFPMLVSTLSTQALAALGFLNDPLSGKPNINREIAKHFINTLGVLEEKTQGNLSGDEQTMLTETLHQLRMAFVAAKNQQAELGETFEPEKPSSIELP